MQDDGDSYTGVARSPHRNYFSSTWYYTIHINNRLVAYQGGFKSAEAASEARRAALSLKGYVDEHDIQPHRYR